MTALPYSLRSFRAIAERESRRGSNLSRTVPAVKDAVRELRTRREQYKLEVTPLALGSPARLAARDKFHLDRKELRQKRDEALEGALQEALTQFEHSMAEDRFTFGLAPAVKLENRQTYQVSSALDVAFPAKQAAAVIRDLRAADSQSRNGVVRALKEALGKRYGHAIYRLDIASFFGSIPHEELLSRLHSLRRLDTVTTALVTQLLNEFSQITGTNKGVPQGVGMSSQLADFYLSEFDRKMKAIPGVLFYARYVDDMVLVLESSAVLEAVKLEIDTELQILGLTKNLAKTQEIETTPDGNYSAGVALEYLGYRFTRADKCLTTGLTKNRHQRRINRLNNTLEAWLDTSPDAGNPNHGHDGMLIDRLRYLAGNTKLLNSKDNVAIGLFFSNSALDATAKELSDLDTVLKRFRADHADKMSDRLREKVSTISFVNMFADRTFYRFSQRKVQRIVQAWEEGTS